MQHKQLSDNVIAALAAKRKRYVVYYDSMARALGVVHPEHYPLRVECFHGFGGEDYEVEDQSKWPSRDLGREVIAIASEGPVTRSSPWRPVIPLSTGGNTTSACLPSASHRPSRSSCGSYGPCLRNEMSLEITPTVAAIAGEIRAFLLDRGIAVAKGLDRLRAALLASRARAPIPFLRACCTSSNLVADWRRLDQRIDNVSLEIEALAKEDAACERSIAVSGIGPIISSAKVAAIGAAGAGREPCLSIVQCFTATGSGQSVDMYSRLHSGNGPPLTKYTPTEMRMTAVQSIAVGHSPRIGMAMRTVIAGQQAKASAELRNSK
jgi:hypothetical protein